MRHCHNGNVTTKYEPILCGFVFGLFCLYRGNLIFLLFCVTNRTLLSRYGVERGITTFQSKWKGCVIMKPSDFQKTTQCQFDSLLKKVVRGSVRDYKKQQSRLKKKEISFCEMPEIVIEKIMTWDDYDTDCTTFQVCGMDIKIFDDTLAEAIQTLPEC